MGAAISYKYTNNYSTLHGYKVMTVRIDETKSNPDTCCTYQDDAVGMSSGANADEWTEFFGYRPCLLRNSLNGLEVKYLNPDNYTKFIDGTTADISSGYAGNVMIEFPRRGIKLSRSGNYLYVSMTDDPDADGYNYYRIPIAYNNEWFREEQLLKYATGGLVDYTGPAWVDGTKSKPEAFLSSSDTQNIANLRDVLSKVYNSPKTSDNISQNQNNGDTYYEFHITVEELGDKYTAEDMMEDMEKYILQKSNYRNVISIGRKK